MDQTIIGFGGGIETRRTDRYFIGGSGPETICRLAAKIDAPLNIMAGTGYPNVATLASLGVGV